MTYLNQRTNIGEIEAYADTLPNNKERIAYLSNYFSRVNIVLNPLKMFMETGKIKLLLYDKIFMETLKDEKIIVTASADIYELQGQICDYMDRLHIVLNQISELANKYIDYDNLNYEPNGEYVEVDPRIVCNYTQEVLREIFKNAENAGFFQRGWAEKYVSYFRCTDSGPYDRNLCKSPMQWFGSDNESVVFADELNDQRVVMLNQKKIYEPFEKLFRTERNTPLIDMAKKHNNIMHSTTNYDHVKVVIWDALKKFGIPIRKAKLICRKKHR